MYAINDMEKSEKRTKIKYLNIKGMPPKESQEKHEKKNLGDECPSFSAVKNWTAELKRRRTITENEPRSGRAKDVTTDLQVDAVHCMVINDIRVTIQHIW